MRYNLYCLGYGDCVEYLLSIGADADKRNNDAMAPLQWAAVGGHTRAAKALLAAKACLEHADRSQGRTALVWAASACEDKVGY